MAETGIIRIKREDLENLCTRVFIKLGMPELQARDSAEILVAADARGIGSHGVARLWRYVNGITAGIMLPVTESEVVHRTPISFVLDAKGGIGLSLSKRVMSEVVETAKKSGFAAASVRDSNHFGIAGYYALMAVPEDMIGIVMTNTAALGVPTFGKEAMFGTNPIAVAVPALNQPPFVLDMATTVVTRGKVETYERDEKPLPEGWAVNTEGLDTQDAESLLKDMLYQAGGGILPLGGRGEAFGGHKGFGLGVLVDILTAVTSGGTFGKTVKDSAETSARVCHFFAAIKIDLFRKPEEFRAAMDVLLTELRDAEPATGQERVYYAGLKEFEHEQLCERVGIPVPEKVWDRLAGIADDLQVTMPAQMEKGYI
jgi:L-2-hydroxycarboxylate dehydrogenase (NAD+)